MTNMRMVFFSIFLFSFLFFLFPFPSYAQAPEVKVAFIGDDGISQSSTGKVLDLIKREGADFVMDQGDLDYKNDPAAWDTFVTQHLGASFPYFVSVGNHDDDKWKGAGGYASYIHNRWNAVTKGAGDLCVIQGNTPDNTGVLQHCIFKGIFFVLSGIGNSTSFITTSQADYEQHIRTQITSAQAQQAGWRVCSWHHNQKELQVGGKSSTVGWTAYEDCRKAGAIIANAHEHSYSRTKTIINFPSFTVDPVCPQENVLCVAAQKTFAFVSGLGGSSVRTQQRCLPGSTTPDCAIWGKIYTSNQGATYGAMFITFNKGGDPKKAHGYFKNINDQIVDDFQITTSAVASGPTPPLSPTRSPSSPTPGQSANPCTPQSPTQFSCFGDWYQAMYANGDVNKADFNRDGKASLVDFEVWRRGFLDANRMPTSTLSPTSSTSTLTPSVTISTPTRSPTQTVVTLTPSLTPSPTTSNARMSGNTIAGVTVTPRSSQSGMWISTSEIQALPTSGSGWENILSAARAGWGSAQLSNQDSHHPQYVLAGALVSVRLNDSSLRTKTVQALMEVSRQLPDRSLDLGRNLAAYVIAADILNLSTNHPSEHQTFSSFVRTMRDRQNSEGRSLVTCHEVRPNNWGTMCGASRIAADLYLKDTTDLTKALAVYKGFIGDRASWPSFEYAPDAQSWSCAGSAMIPMNASGCTKSGKNLSGALIDDVQREGPFTSPFRQSTNYPWGGYSGILVQAELLYRAGYDAYTWQEKAMLRGMEFIQNEYKGGASPATDWVPWIINKRYGVSIPATTPTGWGRLLAWTDWTHR